MSGLNIPDEEDDVQGWSTVIEPKPQSPYVEKTYASTEALAAGSLSDFLRFAVLHELKQREKALEPSSVLKENTPSKALREGVIPIGVKKKTLVFQGNVSELRMPDSSLRRKTSLIARKKTEPFVEEVKDLGAGPHSYRLRRSTLIDFVGGEVELARFKGEGTTWEAALDSLGHHIHRRYQELKYKGAHAWTDEEESDWQCLSEYFDLEHFETTRPQIERKLGEVLSTNDTEVRIRWNAEDDGEVVVSMDDLPAEAIAVLVAGEWFLATVRLTANSIEWLEVRREPAPVNENLVWNRFVGACSESVR